MRALISLALLSGCVTEVAPYTDDVFWLQLVDEGATCPDVEVTTTMANAEPRQSFFSRFDSTISESASSGGRYAYITKSEDGTSSRTSTAAFSWARKMRRPV